MMPAQTDDTIPHAGAWRALDDEMCPFCLRGGVEGRTWRQASCYESEERHCTRCQRTWWTHSRAT